MNKSSSSNGGKYYNNLPCECREVICSFLAPPDAYNLCMADPKCFVLNRQDDMVQRGDIATRHRGKEMIRQTLMNSLYRALQPYRDQFTVQDFIDSFVNMSRRLPLGSVALGGSLVVQAVLGDQWLPNKLPYGDNYVCDGNLYCLRRQWRSNVVVFCNADVHVYVRSWLVASADLVLVDCDNPSAFSSRTHTHMVERYTKAPIDGKHFQYNNIAWKFQREAAATGSIQLPYGEYTISTAANVPLLYEKRLIDQRTGRSLCIDLAVASQGTQCTDIPNEYELDICRCMFNGGSFIIPRPNATFRRQTRLNPSLPVHDMIMAYITAIARGCNSTFGNLFKGQTRLSFLFRKLGLEIPTHQRIGTLFSPDLDACVWSIEVRCAVKRVRDFVIRRALQDRATVRAAYDDDIFSELMFPYHRGIHLNPLEMHNHLAIYYLNHIVLYTNHGVSLIDLPNVNFGNESVVANAMRELPEAL